MKSLCKFKELTSVTNSSSSLALEVLSLGRWKSSSSAAIIVNFVNCYRHEFNCSVCATLHPFGENPYNRPLLYTLAMALWTSCDSSSFWIVSDHCRQEFWQAFKQEKSRKRLEDRRCAWESGFSSWCPRHSRSLLASLAFLAAWSCWKNECNAMEAMLHHLEINEWMAGFRNMSSKK